MSKDFIHVSPTQPPEVVPVLAYAAPAGGKSPLQHAKVISSLTLLSRILGMARESVSADVFGTGAVSVAFSVAFSIPNLFRKLFGEGALSAAFIPLYAGEVRQRPENANTFAAASVNLLCLTLGVITLLGELVVVAVILGFGHHMLYDRLLTLKFTVVMLPYVVLICGTAFLSSILQVHHRFGLPAFAPVLLNVIHIVVIVLGARLLHIHRGLLDAQTLAQQRLLAYWLCGAVLVAGVMQVAILLPELRAVGFRLHWTKHLWTPQVKQMLRLSVPVAMSAGVLQISVLMDKGISLLLSRAPGHDTFGFLGLAIRYPMESGAAARLNWAQFLYQFPLGVFAIALATAIFPSLSADALEKDGARFRGALRLGIEATMLEGLAASIGLIAVRHPAIRLLFQHGALKAADADLIARSLVFYASGIWAFSLLQIINRAYYALHDMRTPFIMAVVNIIVNLAVELPLVWVRRLGEAGMAVGTCISFAVQALIMLYMLDKRLGGLGMKAIILNILKMTAAAAAMGIVCFGVQYFPFYHADDQRKLVWAAQLCVLTALGAGVYIGFCRAMRLVVLDELLPRRLRRVVGK